MLRCFTPGGRLGPKQADSGLQVDDAGTQQNIKDSCVATNIVDLDDTRPKRDQARPAAQLPLHKLPAAPPSALYPYIMQHGRGIMSLSTLQQGLQHFLLPGVGYIAYAMMYNGPDLFNVQSPLALGDPICDPSNYWLMAESFLQQHPKAIFMQVGAEFAAVLQSCGLLVNSMGGETVLDVATYTFAGYAKRGLRSAIASAAKGVVVEEVLQAPMTPQQLAGQAQTAAAGSGASAGCSPDLVCEMQQVDKEWLSRKGKHAGRFWLINRQPVLAPEPCVRKFTAREAATGRLLGYMFFDAVYEAGQVVGYYANVTRMRPDAHPGVLNLLVSSFMDRVRQESQLAAPAKKLSMRKSMRRKLEQQAAAAAAAAAGSNMAAPADTTAVAAATGSSSSSVRFVSLGLSPLHQMDDSCFKHSSNVRSVFEASFKHGAVYYPFQPIAAAKAKYGAGLHNGRFEDPSATYQQMYMAHNRYGASGVVAMFDVAKTVGLWRHPADAAGIYLQQKLKQGFSQSTAKLQKDKKQQQGGGAACSRAGPAAGAAAGHGPKPVPAVLPKVSADAGAAGDKGSTTLGLVRTGSVLSDNSSLIGTAAAATPGSARWSDPSLPGSSLAGSSTPLSSAAAAAVNSSTHPFYSGGAADRSGSE